MRKTHIVIVILSTDVKHCAGEITVSHRQTKVECPQGCAEAVTDAGKTTTGGGIGFKHEEW